MTAVVELAGKLYIVAGARAVEITKTSKMITSASFFCRYFTSKLAKRARSLFDVSDVSRPTELNNTAIGDRGTDSPALSDHKALLFSKDKQLLVLPILLAEIDEAQYPNSARA